MTFGGFRRPSGGREPNAERALSASALLPTSAFVALGTLTVLLVAQMGMPPLSAVVGPSAHDGGRAVTTPHLSVSIGEARVDLFGIRTSRAGTRAGIPPANVSVTLDDYEQSDLTTVVPLVALPGPAAESSAVLASQRAHAKSGHAARHMAKHAKHAKHVRHAAKDAKAGKADKADKVSKHVEATKSI